jgi:hypothetical protein
MLYRVGVNTRQLGHVRQYLMQKSPEAPASKIILSECIARALNKEVQAGEWVGQE